MTGTITYILSRAGYRAMNGPLADERRRLAGAEPPAAYVSYDPRLLAGAGWYGYRIALNGGDRQMTELARYMLSERYVIRDGYEYYADGVYVFGVLLRERVPHYGIGGGAPTPEPEALNFYMPNGGTISLNKKGNPTVVELEYSIDRGQTWTVWQEDANGHRSLVLSAGQRMYVRNTSDIQTGFSTSANNSYRFTSTDTVEAHGNTNSLLCKNAESITTLSSFCYYNLFSNCKSLVTTPELPATVLAESCYCVMFNNCSSIAAGPDLPATTLASECYRAMFYNCSSLVTAPELHATNLVSSCYMYMFENCTSLVVAPELPATVLAGNCYHRLFYNCTSLQEIRTHMTDISASSCLLRWLNGVSPTGDFYCPAELTIPTGDSGIPSGWTRHDI